LWFVLLLEKDSLLFKDLYNFLTELNVTFGKTNRVQTVTTKIHSLCQRSRPPSVYITDFCQLTCDVDWDDNTLISAFWWGLRDDVKDLFLNLLDPLTLTKVIMQAMRCDNRLFECRQACQAAGPPLPPWQVVGAPWPPPPKAKGKRRRKGGGRGGGVSGGKGGLGGGGAWVGSMYHPLPWLPPQTFYKIGSF
jgi:uncharacterized membrane protein YgcG